MSELLRSTLRTTWLRNGAYHRRLIEDLADEQWFAQPAPAHTMNHAAWIGCHLNLYRGVIAALLRGDSFEDPLEAPFGRGSVVSSVPSAHPRITQIRSEAESHLEAVLASLDAAPMERFEAPTPLARWRASCPRVGEQLVTLMIKHESFHLGQLSAWRRALGLPSVPM